MARHVQAIYVEVAGRRLATSCEKVSVKRNRNRTARPTINRQRRAQFFNHGTPEFEITLETVILRGPNVEVDWFALERSEDEFALTLEYDDGRRTTYVPSLVNELSDDAEPDGKAARSVTIVALDERDD